MNTPNHDARTIRAIWILKDPGESFEYRELPGSFTTRGEALVFELGDTRGQDDEFEVLIDRSKSGWRMRFESADGPEDLQFKEYPAGEEVILHHDSLKQAIYLHLPAAMLRQSAP